MKVMFTAVCMTLSKHTQSMATSEPSSTAMATTPQYGRKLLQAASPAPGASTPVVTVVFAVLLPQASQNSLLVLQSNSPVVRKQFAGWFVTQMQARGALVFQLCRLDCHADTCYFKPCQAGKSFLHASLMPCQYVFCYSCPTARQTSSFRHVLALYPSIPVGICRLQCGRQCPVGDCCPRE